MTAVQLVSTVRLVERELDGDRHHNRHRLAVQIGRLVLPLPDGVDCRLIEAGIERNTRISRTRPSSPMIASMITTPWMRAACASGG